MKRIFSLLFAVSVLGFVSCDDDEKASDPAAPTVTLSSTTAQDLPGATVTVTATITAPAGAKQLNVAGNFTQTVTLAGETSTTNDIELLIPATAVVGSSLTAVITVTDNSDQVSAPAIVTITVNNPIIELSGNISANRSLIATESYLLKGQVFVENGATLTIAAGTVVKGQRTSKGTLIVKPGGKLVCNGTAALPVVFTSDQPANGRDKGDWGGIVMLGNAFVNQASQPAIEGISPAVLYGNITSPATNAAENSGTLTYVRIEYAGIEISANNETNSLTMGGVGNGTTISHVQVSYGGDDGFEWFGGTVNAKNLISFATWDDDFDTDFGWSGNVQFGLVVRYPFAADQSGSTAFESDNQANANSIAGCDGTAYANCTRGVFSNITVFGPRDFSTGLIRTGETATTRARSISGNFTQAIHIRRRTAISIFNSFISGYPTGLRIDDQATLDNYNAGEGKIAYNVLTAPSTTVNGATATATGTVFATNIGTGDAAVVNTYYSTAGLTNTFLNPTGAAGWSPVPGTPANSINPYTDNVGSANFWGQNATTENPAGIDGYVANPNFSITSGVLNTGGNFTDGKVSGAFFTQTAYKGAFGATDWTDTWANFVPNSVNY